jgi:SNF2 family DNA or RNA helicase
MITICKEDIVKDQCTLVMMSKTLIPIWKREIEKWWPTARVSIIFYSFNNYVRYLLFQKINFLPKTKYMILFLLIMKE